MDVRERLWQYLADGLEGANSPACDITVVFCDKHREFLFEFKLEDAIAFLAYGYHLNQDLRFNGVESLRVKGAYR